MAREKNIGTPVSSPIVTQNNDDTYATHISKNGRGGPFQAKNIEEMAAIPVDRLFYNAMCTVSEDVVNARPRTTYLLRKLPLKNINDPDEEVLEQPAPIDWPNYEIIPITLDESHEGFYLNYWVVESYAESFDGEYEESYAKNYDGSYYEDNNLEFSEQPPFPYSKDETWNNLNWSTNQDLNVHDWKRIRYGADGKWSKPFRLFSQADPGDEPTTMYKWVLTQAGAPPKPKFMQDDGINVNTTPAGWSDIPTAKPVGDYTLWEIRGILNGFGELKRPWIGPFEIPLDGNLVRYSDSSTPNPNSLVGTSVDASTGSTGDNSLNQNGWYADPQPKTQFIAKRSDNGDGTFTEWVVEQIGGEGSLTRVFIYRLFPKTLVNYITNNPDAIYLVADGGDGRPFRPQGDAPKGWQDAQTPNPSQDLINFESSAWFYNNGKRKTKWSDPVPMSPDDLYNAVIDTNGVNNFRYNTNDVVKRDITEIDITAKLYRGEELLNLPQAPSIYDISYEWTRIRNGASTVDVSFGTAQTITIVPDDVDQVATFQVKQTLSDGKGNDKIFYERIDIFDFADGNNARTVSLRRTSDFFVTKQAATTPNSIKLEAFAMNLVYANDSSHVSWYYGNRDTDSWTLIAGENNDVYEVLPAFFETNKITDYLDFKVEIIDDVTNATFLDSTRISSVTLEDGVMDIFMTLSNDFVQVPVNSSGSLINTDPSATYITGCKIYEEGVDITNNYTIMASPDIRVTTDDGNAGNVSVNINNTLKQVSLSVWDSNVVEAFVEVAMEHTSSPLSNPVLVRTWSLKRVFNGSEFILQADIDVDTSSPTDGFYFKPGESGNKILKAVAYINGQEVTDYTGYTFSWNAEGLTGSSRLFTIQPSDVDVVLDVKLTLIGPGGVGAQTRIKIEDIPDAVGLQELFYPEGADPNKPDQNYSYYEPCNVTTIEGAKASGASIQIPLGACVSDGNFSVIVSAYNDGGTDWFLFSSETGNRWKNGENGKAFYDEGYYIFHYETNGDTDTLYLMNTGASDANTKLKVVVQPNNTKWSTELLKETVFKSYKRSNEDQTKWIEPYRFVGEEGQIGRPGAFLAEFITVQPTTTQSVSRPSRTVLPEVPGTKTLKSSFTSNGVTWYSKGNLPTINYRTHRTWITYKFVRFDDSDNFTSSVNDEWTVPQPMGGTDGLKPDTTVFIFRRSASKPTGADLPINGLTIEQSGGSKWSVTQPIGSTQLWMSQAIFENNVITDVYVQKTSYSDPVPFEAVGSKTAWMYHPVINNDPRDQPPAPTATPDQVLAAGNSFVSGTWAKDSNTIVAGWKAEAYYNGSWSIWFITPLQGSVGVPGEDGSRWYNEANMYAVNSGRYDSRGATEISKVGTNTGDYLIFPSGEFFEKVASGSQHIRRGRLGTRVFEYNDISNKTAVVNSGDVPYSFRTPNSQGSYGDICIQIEGTELRLYKVQGYVYPGDYVVWSEISKINTLGQIKENEVTNEGTISLTNFEDPKSGTVVGAGKVFKSFVVKETGNYDIDLIINCQTDTAGYVTAKFYNNFNQVIREYYVNLDDNTDVPGNLGRVKQARILIDSLALQEGETYKMEVSTVFVMIAIQTSTKMIISKYNPY